jgi:hypothetical protein
MPVFGVELQGNDLAPFKKFVRETNDRIENCGVISSPYNGRVTLKKNIALIDLEPIWPNLSFLGILIPVVVLFFGLSLYWLFATIPFILLGMSFHPSFVFKVFKKGAKKAGYEGQIKMLTQKQLIRWLAYGGKN